MAGENTDMFQGIMDDLLVRQGGNPQNLGRSVPQGALQQVAQAKPETAGDLERKEYQRMAGEYPAARAKSDASFEELMAGLKGYSPDPSEKWLNFAANIAKPTKFGTWGEVATNVASGLEPIVGKENALKNQYKQLALQMGYQANEKNADQLASGMQATLKNMGANEIARRASAGSVLPNGNAIIKAGDRNFEVIPDQSQPEGYRLKEIISSVKTIGSADTKLKMAQSLAEKSLEGVSFSTPEAKQKKYKEAVEAFQTVPDDALAHMHGVMIAPAITANGASPPVGGTPPPVAAGMAPPGGFSEQATVKGENGPTRSDGRPSGFPVVYKEAQSTANAGRDAIRNQELLAATQRMNNAPLGSPERAQAQQEVISLKREAASTSTQKPTGPSAFIRGPQETKRQEVVGAGEGKKEVEQPAATTALADFLDESANTKRILNEALSHPGLPKATGEQGMIPFRGNVMTAGGTDSAGYKAKVDALSAQLGFQKMQAMKAASASGSTGLGAVTEAEHKLLQQQIDSLSSLPNSKQVEASMRNIQERLDKMRERMVEAYGRQYPGMVRQIKGKTFVQGKDGLWNPL